MIDTYDNAEIFILVNQCDGLDDCSEDEIIEVAII